MVFKEKITVYADNYSKTHKYKTQLLIVEWSGTYSYH
jgi:hypothetical protein